MKKGLILFLFFLPGLLKAQHLMIQGSSGNLYLQHTTAAKENFYSIGRLYNISPKEIAPYNNLTLDKGLSLGKEIKIPLKENFTQTNDVGVDEVAVPLYHKTAAKETLTALSTHYNKVPAVSLKAWNNLKTDAISPGQDLIVGYIKVKKELSSLPQTYMSIGGFKGMASVYSGNAAKAEDKKMPETPVVKKEDVKTTLPVVQAPATVKQIPVVVKPEPTPEKKAVEVPAMKTAPGGDFKGGVFKTLYTETGKTENGTAGVFKSLNGWEDGKYYCLTGNAQQGTIVKITNKATGKTVYAKVLDGMPDLKQNQDLLIRVSSAAGDALGAGENNFECTVNY